MSLMLGLMVGSFGLVACGDDDDKDSSGGGGGGTPSTEVDTDKLIGLWYGIDENSENKVCIFSVNFMANGVGSYTEIKARAKHNWEPEGEAAQMTWLLSGVTVKFLVTIPDKGTVERKADILNMTDNEITIKRYLDEGTDVMTLKRAKNEEEVFMVFAQLVAEKSSTESGDVIADDLIGVWYGIDENSDNKVNVFCIRFADNGEGYYSELKAKAKNNWQPEAESAEMSWELDGVTVRFFVTIPDKGTLERKADILNVTENEITIKRYLEEGTDEMVIKRAEDEDEVGRIFWGLVEKRKN